MTKPRVKETDQGIQGEPTVTAYDAMLKHMRDRGWIETEQILNSGITEGHALEIGPGPGYLGLEWLKHSQGTTLTGLDISPDMIALARRNAQAYGLTDRAEYVQGNASQMRLADASFDAVFTNGSLHEWADPQAIFNEIWRVLRPGGKVLISDLRRDMLMPLKWFLWFNTQPKSIRPGLITSLNAAYTPSELSSLVAPTRLTGFHVSSNLLGLTLAGNKA